MYKKKILFLMAAVTYTILNIASFSTPETNVTVNGLRQAVNFKGSLITYQGNNYPSIDNISINNKYNHILVVDKPNANSLPKAIKNEKTGRLEIVLNKDPYKEYTGTQIDLNEIKKITSIVDTVYVYYPEGKKKGTEFIEINVYSNDKNQTKNSYLIDHKIKINFNEINEAGPIKKDSPIMAVKELIIKEYSAQNGTVEGTASVKNELKK